MARPRKLPEVVSLKEGHTFRKRGYLYKVDFRNQNDERVLRLYRHGEKDLAESFAEAERVKIAKHGNQTAAILTDAALREAAECIRQLGAMGKTLRDATSFYLAHLAANEKSMPVSELIDLVIESKRREQKSPRYIADLESRLGRFSKAFASRSVATITPDEISTWLRDLKLSPVGQNNYRRLLVLTFNSGLKRKVCQSNPAVESEKIKEIESEIAILSPKEAARLLGAADDEILPTVAIGLFAGLRRSELERLEWKEIDFTQGHILVKAEKAKSARKRFVAISANLAAWLKPLAKKSGHVAPQGHAFRLAFDKVRKDAGLLAEWEGNEMRHSFGSYHMAMHKDPGATTAELGHTSPHLVFRHYRKLVSPEAAAVFWSISPESAANVIAMEAKSA